jgi:flagellar hook-basal body complex protein FliE
MASPTVAANAYANLARILDTGSAGKGSEAGGPSFGAVLKDAIGSVLEAGPTNYRFLPFATNRR